MAVTIEQRNLQVRAWLGRRPLFNFAALCREIDYDRGAFARFLTNGGSRHYLSEEPLTRLENALVPYGYNKIN